MKTPSYSFCLCFQVFFIVVTNIMLHIPARIIRRLDEFILSIDDFVQIKRYLVCIRIWMPEFFTSSCIRIVLVVVSSFLAILALASTIIMIPSE